MDNKYVYCTYCKYFNLNEDDEIPNCKYENICDIWNCEDSKNIKRRPCYKDRRAGVNNE